MKNVLGKLFAQYPSLNYVGLALWLGWSAVAFSRAFEFYDFISASNVFGLFTFIQIGSIVVFLLAAVLPEQVSSRLLSPSALFASAGVATLCIVSTIALFELADEGAIGSSSYAAIYAIASILTGASLVPLFLKCIVPFCSQAPKRATLRFAQTLFQSGLYYFLVVGSPRIFSLVLFCLTPLLIVILQIPTRSSTAKPSAKSTSQFNRPLIGLFVAMTIYAIAMRIFEPYVASVLPRDSSMFVSSFSICLLLIVTIALVCAVVTVKGAFPFGRIYHLAIALLLVTVLSPSVFNSSPVMLSILCLAIVHFLTMLYRCILAYIVFQSGMNPMKLFGFGMAAISLGSLIGNVAGALLIRVASELELLYLLSFAMVFLCIIAAFLIFPESKMKALLLPVDEPALDALENKERPVKWWMEAAERAARQGRLSEREKEVFFLLVRGKSTQQIADKLFLSPYTVKAHTRNIYAKLDIHSRNELNDYVDKQINASQPLP
ncbi:response regulator transcription factor [Raoultibacter massiliensis]|uniref:helix-turn-helix transcriptional regulator n=1 Tax=Raoultibacter massiliensis TaxID=1852371 RepID=UPI003A9251E5